MDSFVARMLGWASSPVDRADGVGGADNLRAFRLFLLVHAAARSFLTFPAEAPWWDSGLHATTIVAAGVACLPGMAQRLLPLVAALVAGQLVAAIVVGADTANHVFLELVFLCVCALCSVDDDDERALWLPVMRWLVAPFFFYTGFQKIVYGSYFDGQFLTYMAATTDHFHAVFQFAIPEAELERLRAFNGAPVAPGRYSPPVGAGPYRVEAPLFVAMSNAVYLFEMGAGIALLVPRLRALAALAAIGFVVAIEAGARELTFGALMIALLLLFVEGAWMRRVLPLLLAFYAYLVLADHHGLGWLPIFWYRA